MANDRNQSRVDKFAKRRKNRKMLSTMLAVGGIFLVLLVISLVFGSNDTEKTADKEGTDETLSNETGEAKDQPDDDKPEMNDEEESDSDKDDVKKEKIETPDDDNVVEAYKGDWEPIGTDQEGQHTIQLDEGSEDREEIEEAARMGAELDEDNMTLWWVTGEGAQEVVATVSDKDDPKTSRVYLKWVDKEGWKPTKVEVLKENDKKR